MGRRGSRPALRLVALLASFTLIFTGISAKLVHLQVVRAEPLGDMGAKQRVRTIEIPAKRGAILDRDGNPLAMSSEARAIYANPKLVEYPVEAALTLAPLLGVDEETLIERLSKDTSFVYLARHVELRIAQKVIALDLPYIGVLKESRRDYPAGQLGGQVLGFVGTDGGGLAGLEALYDEVLRGTPGRQVVEQDPTGRPIPQGRSSLREPVEGTTLALTIDRSIQFFAEQALARGAKRTKAKRGTAVVLDTRTGDVLAMANWPPMNPNSFADADEMARRNRVVTDAYEPGSVNKVITAAAAIEAGLVTPHTRMKVADTIRVADRTFNDYESHPTKKMTYGEALAESSNVGTIKVALKLGKKRLSNALKRFGFGAPTGVGFPGETDGIVLDPEDWYGTSMATIPIGQGIAVSPLQVASVYQTLANDGVRLQPRLLRGRVADDGRLVAEPRPKGTRIVSAYTAAQVRGMLLGAAEHGTGRTARIPGYLVGGKTGTAGVPRPGGRGYSNEIVTTFAGMAPIDAPRLVVIVSLDNPTPRFASATAAPVWREIMTFALGHEGIAPTVPLSTRGSRPVRP